MVRVSVAAGCGGATVPEASPAPLRNRPLPPLQERRKEEKRRVRRERYKYTYIYTTNATIYILCLYDACIYMMYLLYDDINICIYLSTTLYSTLTLTLLCCALLYCTCLPAPPRSPGTGRI